MDRRQKTLRGRVRGAVQLTDPTPQSPAPDETDSFDTALKTAQSAICFLAERRIPPTPGRIEVIYTFLTGQMAELTHRIERLIVQNKLTMEAIDEMHRHFLVHAENDDAILKDASQRFEQTVQDVSDCIATATNKTERFTHVLVDFRSSAGATASALPGLSQVLAGADEIVAANRVLNDRLVASSRDIRNLREHLERLERDAASDPLTRISNRKSFDLALRKATAEAARQNLPLCLLMIDIDHFKQFNDTHGHVLGDQILRLVARTITRLVREEDIPARYGGEEFTVVLPGATLDKAVEIADTIRLNVASKNAVNRRTGAVLGTITLSAGVAQYRPGESLTSLIIRADEVMYLAKQQGRNRVLSERDIPGTPREPPSDRSIQERAS